MTKADKIQLGMFGLLGILVILAVIYLVTIFGKKDKAPDTSELIKAKDETIQAVIRERETFREWKDALIAENYKKDSLLQIKYKANTIIYEKTIPATVNNYSDHELQSAVESYR